MSDYADQIQPVGQLGPSGDQRWFPFTALSRRPHLLWPAQKPAAVSVVIDLRAAEWEHPESLPAVRPPGGRGIAPFPDIPRMSNREFGHRVGVFRLGEILQSVGLRASVVIDVMTVEKYAPLLDHLRQFTSEFIAGGMSASRPITSRMTEDEELHYIETTMERLMSGLGVTPDGWLGAAHSESFRTPRLLASCGIRYVADWGNDERPYLLMGMASGMWSFPLSWELSDLRAMHERGVSPERYSKSIVEAIDVVASDGAPEGRMVALHLHPWVSGQAFRADALERAFKVITKAESHIWHASPGQIIDWCQSRAEALEDANGTS